jgi:hypothetical protein
MWQGLPGSVPGSSPAGTVVAGVPVVAGGSPCTLELGRTKLELEGVKEGLNVAIPRSIAISLHLRSRFSRNTLLSKRLRFTMLAVGWFGAVAGRIGAVAGAAGEPSQAGLPRSACSCCPGDSGWGGVMGRSAGPDGQAGLSHFNFSDDSDEIKFTSRSMLSESQGIIGWERLMISRDGNGRFHGRVH